MTSRSFVASVLLLSAACASCKDDKPRSDTPPPPPPEAPVAKAGACSAGGGELSDAISAPFFAKTAGGYCVDPQGEIKTYGEKGKLSKGGMDSKLKAVDNAAKSGANVVIANAARPHILKGIFEGRDIGTFVPGRAL